MVVGKHAVIAGSGRSGTTFLVEFLSACGVPTHPMHELGYFPEARAGREQSLLDENAGYLAKDPWLFDYVDQIDLNEIEIEAMIIPVRDLRAAAASRVLQERTQRYSNGSLRPHRNSFGDTPAGTHSSLDVNDQEKLLAVGLSRLMSWCLAHDIPMYLLQYPRLVTDGDYLIDTLWPWLSQFTHRDHARAEFAALAMPQLQLDDLTVTAGRDDEKLELLIQVESLTRTLDNKSAVVAEQMKTVQLLTTQLEVAESHLRAVDAEWIQLMHRLEEADIDRMSVQNDCARLSKKVHHLTRERDATRLHIAAMKMSRTWRIGQLFARPVSFVTQLLRRLS